MPFATIDEAWNVKKFTSDLNMNNLTNDNIFANASYMPIEDKKKPTNLKNNYSRSYNRLPEHSGNKTRLKDDESLLYVRNEDGNSLIEVPENHPTYLNQDLPINEYNLKRYEELNDQYISLKNKKNKNEKFNDYRNINNSSNTKELLEIISELKKENKKLNEIVEKLKTEKGSDKDSVMDLCIYISSGILIIFMMENVSKLIRRF
jgi:hypothetical protein